MTSQQVRAHGQLTGLRGQPCPNPRTIPAPPAHSNVDCDEVVYGVPGPGGEATIAFHSAGFPHGPKPGAYEASVGATRAEMTAYMVDTFRPLKLAHAAQAFDDPAYMRTWIG